MSDNTQELREQLAAIEHERWSDWQKWCHKVLREELRFNDMETNLEEILKRWDVQIDTPFDQLTEMERDSDREQVDRYWHLIEAYVKSQTNQAVLEALDIIETDIIGIAPACTPDCNQTQRAYHQGGWDLMTKQEEKLDTLRQELSGGTD